MTSDAPASESRFAPDNGNFQTRPSSLVSERAAITRRVATFRAHQARLEKERADYYNATRRKIETALSLPPASTPPASQPR